MAEEAFSDAAIQAYLTLKALSGWPLRQRAGIVESLLGRFGPDWSMPDFGTLYRNQKALPVAIAYPPK